MLVAEELLNARILVVDDQPTDLYIARKVLNECGYTNVSCVSDPRAACEMYLQRPFEMVLLDLLMPETDGFELIETLRRAHHDAYLPIIAVTTDPDLIERALECGVRDFIGKPLRIAEVRSRLRNALQVGHLWAGLQAQQSDLERTLLIRTDRLRESEEVFRLFANQLPQAISIRGTRDRVFRYLNPAFQSVVGHPVVPGDTIDKVLDAVHAEDQAAIREAIARKPEGGIDLEVRFIHGEGASRHAQVRTFPINDAEGRPQWVGGIIEDITARKSVENALRESESRFRALVEQSIAGIYLAAGGRFTYVNPRMCEMLGYSAHELQGVDITDLVIEEDRELLARNRLRREAGKVDDLAATYRLRRKDGTVLHLGVDGKLLNLEGREVLLGIGQDVTESARARELLREAETHYRALVEQSIVGVYIVALDTFKTTYANPRLCAMTGFSSTELAGIDLRDIVVEEDRELLQERVSRRAAGDTGSIPMHCRIRAKDGRIVYLVVESKVIDLGGSLSAIGIVQDVTEREIAAIALRESEEKYRVLWETTTDAVILLDDDMRITYANPSVSDVFGYRPDEIEGKDIGMLQPVRLRDAHRRGFKRYLETGEKRLDWKSTETFALNRDGREFPVEITFSHIVVGKKSVFAAFMRDITMRKRAQAELEYANQRLNVLSRSVLDIQEQERRSISRDLHDDIGQSLLALKMGLHRLQGHVDERGDAVLADCIDVSDAIREKVSEMSLQLRPPQLEQLGLPDALRWLTSRQRSLTGLAVACRFGFAGRSPSDVESACYRICQEALNNATRHSRARHIVVELDADAESLILTVRDDGVGFHREAGREAALLSGNLGLISMEERARLAGGRLEIKAAPGHGTTVCAYFPLGPEAEVEAAGAGGASAS